VSIKNNQTPPLSSPFPKGRNLILPPFVKGRVGVGSKRSLAYDKNI